MKIPSVLANNVPHKNITLVIDYTASEYVLEKTTVTAWYVCENSKTDR